MKTKFAKKQEVEHKWYVVDAKDEVLGRMACRIATYLRGKHKPIFTPNVDTGDFVIVVNADRVRVTGKKLTDKMYYRHSGYIGSIKETALKDRMKDEPEKVITDAVWGMLPKNRLGRQMIKKLKVYRGAEHSHAAQKPEIIQITK
ncbi:MAG: 50S ribosomal protein L13 [Nitrospirae bacterium GWC2_46_6]|nr:MAG: 50S ribosomal protein L13 [Nitrospirae bacterium GWA2_46_11]OGW22674.1 MAG: 50S ribosomal protein L13 [Nitrospirae bacterium GWC2_46_6]OGW23529.1 MAG: 50S ribosomal protein L13 [Nitrospirae bacterium GWB2_47_37]HAK87501.1 50S ribosomal protein L13 [Nitrospiraceae bacterium]HCZ11749.1 50S ribosomal protein L13 [Nitrospiraceae bacterium]